jgi:hypothetical protein
MFKLDPKSETRDNSVTRRPKVEVLVEESLVFAALIFLTGVWPRRGFIRAAGRPLIRRHSPSKDGRLSTPYAATFF